MDTAKKGKPKFDMQIDEGEYAVIRVGDFEKKYILKVASDELRIEAPHESQLMTVLSDFIGVDEAYVIANAKEVLKNHKSLIDWVEQNPDKILKIKGIANENGKNKV